MPNPAVHEAVFQLYLDLAACLTKGGQLSDISLTSMELRSMRAIKSSQNATPAEIAQILKRDRGQVTRLIGDLTKKSMVTSKPNPDDGRGRLLALTDQGEAIFAKVAAEEAKIHSKLMIGIEPNQLDVFFQVAGQLSANAAKI